MQYVGKRVADTEARAWHALTASAALQFLNSDVSSLSTAEAARRLKEHGPNLIPEGQRAGPFAIFVRQFKSPLIYILLFATALSLVMGDASDAIFISVVLLLNALVGTVQEVKADASARALRSLVAQRAMVRRTEGVREIDACEIMPGDIVELESGMRVTADLRLVDSHGLEIDEAPLTGESLPVRKEAQCDLTSDTLLADRTNMAHAGTAVISGRGLGVVVATGAETAIGRIAASLDEAARAAAQTPLLRRMEQLARHIAIGTLVLILLLAALLAMQGEGWRDIALLAIALAVSAIPEGLPIAVTVALSAAARRMAKRNVIVRALPAVEGLGSCTLIASDKTGTLTKNRLTVERVVLSGSLAFERGEWRQGKTSSRLRRLAEAAALCNEGTLSQAGEFIGGATS